MVDLLVSLVLSLAAFAGFLTVLYWVYPYALVQGFLRYSNYWLAGLHRKFVTAGGFTFSYLEREGTSSPQTAAAPHVTAVFVPGFSASKAMWTPVSVYFPPEWKVVMVDMPGHGESTFIPGADYSAYGMARKLHDFIGALELKNVHLVGISMGSLVSAAYAALYPDQIDSLTIMCIPGIHILPKGVKTRFFEALENGCNLIMPRNAKEFKDMLRLVLHNPTPYMFHDRFLEALIKIQAEKYVCLEEIMNDTTENDPQYICSMADNIKAPTLILWGDSDQVCHLSGAAIIGRLIKNSQVVVVKKCGHAMTMDRPRKCSKLLCQFINRVTSSSVDL